MKAPDSSKNNKTKDQPKEQDHEARVVGIVNIGTQPAWVWQGKDMPASNKIMIFYELGESLMEDKRPHHVHEEINFKFVETEALSSTLAMRCRAIDPYNDNQDGNNLEALLGMPCSVRVKYNDKGYVKIKRESVTAIPSKYRDAVVNLQNDTFTYDLDNHDQEAFDNLYKWVQDKVMKSEEWSSINTSTDNDEDIPF